MDDIDTGKNILTSHSLHWTVFISAKYIVTIHKTFDFFFIYISSQVCCSEKAFRVHYPTFDQTRMIKCLDCHWIAWVTHHLAVAQSYFQEVGEWAIKKDSLSKGKWPFSIWDLQGVFLDVIRTDLGTKDNGIAHLSFLDNMHSEMESMALMWSSCFVK